jgi:diadenosine tetraphosphate (Ap4A) HIT family hydrolase
MPADCYACRLTTGEEALPGGRIHASAHWVVEHCTGPLGLGALIVKPFRHCEHLGDLTAEEAHELGPLLQRVSAAVKTAANADQVYVCLWSHAAWRPVHIHFVVQPAYEGWQSAHPRPGPFVQAAMFQSGEKPPAQDIEKICQQLRVLLKP